MSFQSAKRKASSTLVAPAGDPLKVPAVNKEPVVTEVQPETVSFYSSAIQKAVAENNIPKALALLDEAKALGVKGAQQTFVKAINMMRSK